MRSVPKHWFFCSNLKYWASVTGTNIWQNHASVKDIVWRSDEICHVCQAPWLVLALQYQQLISQTWITSSLSDPWCEKKIASKFNDFPQALFQTSYLLPTLSCVLNCSVHEPMRSYTDFIELGKTEGWWMWSSTVRTKMAGKGGHRHRRWQQLRLTDISAQKRTRRAISNRSFRHSTLNVTLQDHWVELVRIF